MLQTAPHRLVALLAGLALTAGAAGAIGAATRVTPPFQDCLRVAAEDAGFGSQSMARTACSCSSAPQTTFTPSPSPRPRPEHETTSTTGQAMQTTYSVPGISCGHCRAAITSEVNNVAGVNAVDVDLDTKIVTVNGVGFNDAAVRDAIDEAGYDIA
jgi:copper chaperone